jgi:hypothetical protein
MDRRTFLMSVLATTTAPLAGGVLLRSDDLLPAVVRPGVAPMSDPRPKASEPVTATVLDIQGRIDDVAARGGLVRLPAGRFLLDTPLLVHGAGLTIEGEGPGATVLAWKGDGAAIRNANPAEIVRHLTIRGLTISNGEAPGTAGGIELENLYDSLVDRCRFEQIGAQGVGVAFIGSGSTYYNTIRSSWFNCSAAGSTGIRWESRSSDPNANRVIDCTISGRVGSTGMDIMGGDTALVLGCAIEGGELIRLSASYAQLIGNRFEGGPIVVTGNHNKLVANSYADTSPFVNRGSGNVRLGE